MIIDWRNPQAKVSHYFTVADVLSYGINHSPVTSICEYNILAMATQLDHIRDSWGSEIIVSRWFDCQEEEEDHGFLIIPASHHQGNAVNIRCCLPSKEEQCYFEAWLNQHWHGILGFGQELGHNFTYLDMSNGQGWYLPPEEQGLRFTLPFCC